MNIPKYEDTEPIIPKYEETEPIEQKSAIGFGKNLWEDVKGTVSGVGGLAKGLMTQPVETVVSTAKALPGALVEEGKRIGIGELITGHPGKALGKFGEAMYEKPLTTTLDVLPAAGAAGKGIGAASKALGFGGKAARGVELAAEAGQAGKVARGVGLADEAAQAGKVAPILEEAAGVAKAAPTLEGIATRIGEKIPGAVKEPMKEVGSFLKTKFEDVGSKVGEKIGGGTLAKYAQQHARNMAMKAMGAAPGQIRKIGLDKAEKLADYALDRKLVSLGVGDIGRAEKIIQANAEAGQVVGAIRDLATKRGAAHDLPALVEEIKAKLAPEYAKGVKSGEGKQVIKALEEIEMSAPTADKIAQTITKLFQESKKMDRLKQPSGAYADVARELRSANESLMNKYLKPEEIKAYHNALEEYGATTQLKEFVKRKESMEMGGRLGPGSGISRSMVQKALDVVGYRTEAQIVHGLSKWLKKNPGMASKPKEIFRRYIDEAAEAIDEIVNPLE